MANETEEAGIRCPNCGCRHHYTIRTKAAPKNRIMRVRECRNCGRQLITYEAAAGQKLSPPDINDLTPKEREGLIVRLMEFFGMSR